MSSLARRTVLLAVVLLAGVGCKSKSANPSAARASSTTASNLPDLSTSLDAARAAFNARKQEARFLTLLSPT